MNASPLLIAAAIVAGAFAAAQAPTNAMLSKAYGSPILAALISFSVGTAALIGMCLAAGWRTDPELVRALPWHAWLGGLYGAFFVAVAAFAAPRLGATVLIAGIVAGQLLMALTLDHFGLIGLPKSTVSYQRIAGVGLVIVGVLLARQA